MLAVVLQPHVVAIDDPTSPGGQAGVSEDRTIAFTPSTRRRPVGAWPTASDRLVEASRRRGRPGSRSSSAGHSSSFTHLPEPRGSEDRGPDGRGHRAAEPSARRRDGVRSVTALAGLGTRSRSYGCSRGRDIPTLTPTLATMLGLGVGSTTRCSSSPVPEGLGEGSRSRGGGTAIATSVGGPVRRVTVMVAIWGLWVSGMPSSGSSAPCPRSRGDRRARRLTLLPAMLGFIGDRIDALRCRGSAGEAMGTVVACGRDGPHRGMHPWRSLVAGLAVVGLLLVPVFAMRLGSRSASRVRTHAGPRRGAPRAGFGPGLTVRCCSSSTSIARVTRRRCGRSRTRSRPTLNVVMVTEPRPEHGRRDRGADRDPGPAAVG